MAPLLLLFLAADLFDLSGSLSPAASASVSIHRVLSPFVAHAMTGSDGRFTFRKIESGAYIVSVFIPSRGEARQTVEVGPGTADSRRRVAVKLELKDSDFAFEDLIKRRHAINTKQLAIPERAVREYHEAQKLLTKHDVEAAVRRLERAVNIAPQFSGAWNNLGTIAYQRQKYPQAAECFRKALAQDPELYEPLVNLGGVLLKLRRPREAYDYNLRAVVERPNDALANSQFGLTYLELGSMDMAEKYLRKASELDPAHFSHPQLVLAGIHLRQGHPVAAAADLTDFLKHHPDWEQAPAIREKIAEWKKGSL
jgi:tetratricopeptide (TPR) repeat protein